MTRKASRSVTQLYDAVLAPTGLKASQFILLQAIAEHAEIAQCALAREYAIAVETLSRRLTRMRDARWVQMRIGEGKRERFYSLTPEGLRVLSEAMPYWYRAQERLASALGSQAAVHALFQSLNQLATSASHAQSLRVSNIAPRSSVLQMPRSTVTDSAV